MKTAVVTGASSGLGLEFARQVHQVFPEIERVWRVLITDDEEDVHQATKFALRDQLNFTLLSDPEHQIAEAFGVWGEKKFMGKVYDGIHRTSFLIGSDGLIKQVYQDFKTSNHHQVVLKSLP